MEQNKKEKLISAGVDLEGALERFMNNENLYDVFLNKFTTEKSFSDLSNAVAAGNYGEALEISHKLKGSSGSLGFTHLYELLCTQVTLFRQNDNAAAAACMDDIMAEYDRLLTVAKEVI